MKQISSGESRRVRWGLVIHGGVGVLPAEALEGALGEAYKLDLAESLAAGYAAIKGSGTAEDGVVAAIRVMEDSPLFNAGRGSNLTAEGVVSMDASIMVGDSLEAGAVAGVATVRNPIQLARVVMERSGHVMLSSQGADAFAREAGLVTEDPSYFLTQRRWEELQKAKLREGKGADRPNTVDSGMDPGHRSGTVGAVALDSGGRLVAGTSTGGSANKRWGRIGDSPIIGAGTWAGEHCGVSCTGWGEHFIRNAVAHDMEARMAYLGVSLQEAARQIILERLEAQLPGLGGLVAMDRKGNVELRYNTQGMYRGWVDEEGRIEVSIFE